MESEERSRIEQSENEERYEITIQVKDFATASQILEVFKEYGDIIKKTKMDYILLQDEKEIYRSPTWKP
jgi:adenylate cyclase class IV